MSIFAGTAAPQDLRIGTTPVQKVYMGAALVWNRIPLTVSVSPTTLQDQGIAGPAIATASGGSGSYTWSWQRVGGSAVIQADDPSSSVTSFGMLSSYNGSRTATFRCVVSDGQTTANSPDVSVTIFGYGGNDGPPRDPV